MGYEGKPNLTGYGTDFFLYSASGTTRIVRKNDIGDDIEFIVFRRHDDTSSPRGIRVSDAIKDSVKKRGA